MSKWGIKIHKITRKHREKPTQKTLKERRAKLKSYTWSICDKRCLEPVEKPYFFEDDSFFCLHGLIWKSYPRFLIPIHNGVFWKVGIRFLGSRYFLFVAKDKLKREITFPFPLNILSGFQKSEHIGKTRCTNVVSHVFIAFKFGLDANALQQLAGL